MCVKVRDSAAELWGWFWTLGIRGYERKETVEVLPRVTALTVGI